MGKPSKKSATKVEVAPAAAATKPLKKGKRDAEEVTEKQVPAKKQKQNKAALKQAIDKKKTEAKTQKKNKKDETSSEDDSSSESEEEVKVKPVAKKQVKKPVESSSEEDSSSDEEPKSKVSMKEVSAAAVAKNGSVAAKKKDETSDDSDSESEDESDEENETPAKVASKAAPAKVTNVPSKGKEDASESESDDDEKPKVAGAKKDGSSEEDSSEEETSESEEEDKVPKTPKNKGGDVEMADADSKKSNIKDALKTHSTPQVQSTGSKTLFMGNLSFSIEREDVENFFKDAGEIADVRFGSDSEGIFKGYGHVEFVTVEAAQKALKLNGQDLLGRQVKLDLARERGERGPASGNENSYQKGGRGQAQAQGQTIFVKGFDTSGGEEQVRSALEEHFGSCGDITRVSIPQDYEGGLKGIAYMDFTDSNGVSKALKLDGSQLGDGTLTVDEAKPRDNSFGSGGGRGRGRSDGGGRFSGGRGRFGGGGRSGGRFGGDSGGRFGGRGRSGGDRGGRGRGGFSGRKTTFD